MDIVQIVSCIGTVICAVFAFLAYKNAKDVNMKLTNVKKINVDGHGNITQTHDGSGDNVGGNKNG